MKKNTYIIIESPEESKRTRSEEAIANYVKEMYRTGSERSKLNESLDLK